MVNNPFRDYSTKTIKWKDHREFMMLSDAVDSNDKDLVMDILIKLFREGRLKW